MANNNNVTSSENTTNTTNLTNINTGSSYSDFLGHVSTPTTAEMRPITEGFSYQEEE